MWRIFGGLETLFIATLAQAQSNIPQFNEHDFDWMLDPKHIGCSDCTGNGALLVFMAFPFISLLAGALIHGLFRSSETPAVRVALAFIAAACVHYLLLKMFTPYHYLFVPRVGGVTQSRALGHVAALLDALLIYIFVRPRAKKRGVRMQIVWALFGILICIADGLEVDYTA